MRVSSNLWLDGCSLVDSPCFIGSEHSGPASPKILAQIGWKR